MAQLKPAFLSWLRAALASAWALYMAGETDLKTLGLCIVSGLIGPLLKYLDTSSTDFGRTK
jgi:hypothetical protein